MNTEQLEHLTRRAIQAAQSAGDYVTTRTAEVKRLRVQHKDDAGASPASQVVSEVDLASQRIILHYLAPLAREFDLGLLTEESEDDGSRFEKDYFWCVDPLDGTLNFLEERPGYAVSIALVNRRGDPVLGVVYDIARQVLYHGYRGSGLFINHRRKLPSEGATSLKWYCDASFLQSPLFEKAQRAMALLAEKANITELECKPGGAAVVNACLAITSPSGCYFKLPRAEKGGGCLWDYAATACLAREAGAHASDMGLRQLQLNAPGVFLNHCGVLYCSDSKLAEKISQKLSSLNYR